MLPKILKLRLNMAFERSGCLEIDRLGVGGGRDKRSEKLAS